MNCLRERHIPLGLDKLKVNWVERNLFTRSPLFKRRPEDDPPDPTLQRSTTRVLSTRPQRPRKTLLHCVAGSLVAPSDRRDTVPKAGVPVSVKAFDREGRFVHYAQDGEGADFL